MLSLSLLLVASTVTAEPDDRESTERVRLTGTHQKPSDGWYELATPTPANRGREFVIVDAKAGPWTKLRFDATAGRTFVHAVRIEAPGGKHVVYRVAKAIRAGKPAYVELHPPLNIRFLVVVSEGPARARYTVHGAKVR